MKKPTAAPNQTRLNESVDVATRKVRVLMAGEIVREVPEDWTPEDIGAEIEDVVTAIQEDTRP